MGTLLLTVLAVVAGVALLLRPRAPVDDEPWRASLHEDDPLDIDAIREAEDEWLRDSDPEFEVEEEDWR